MSWLTWFFFESLPALAAALFTVNFVLPVLWRRGGRARPLLISLVLSVVLLVAQGLVVTRREHAARLLKAIERDLLLAQTTGLFDALADDFRAGHLDKEQFLSLVTREYERTRVHSLRCSLLEVRDSQPEAFTVETAYQADVRSELIGGWMRSRWQLTFARDANEWKITTIVPLHIDGLTTADWRAIEQR